jgi:amidohydrolase
VDFTRDVEPITPALLEMRRDLHRHPELAFEEHRTAGVVEAHLRALGLEPRRTAGTGVVADLRGGRPGRTVIVRADLDALPILETTGAPYASTAPGKMHACGHDGHTAIAAHVASVLVARREELPGAYRFVFQPAEETVGGASRMIAEGRVLDGVDAVVGLHLANFLPAGVIGVRPGPLMAAPDSFTITVRGRGTHAAMPHLGTDPVVIAAHVITALQTLTSRETDPVGTSVVTISTVRAGDGAHNIIPERCELLGTLRTFDPAVRERLQRRIIELSTGIAAAMGGEASVDLHVGPPPVVNDEALTERFRELAREAVGADRVLEVDPVMGGDDMAEFLAERPGVYFWAGSADPQTGRDRPHHHPGFDFHDELVLPLAVDVLARAAVEFARA